MAPNNFSSFSSKCVEFFFRSIGSLSNDDGDVNEDGKKAIGLDWQITPLHAHFGCISLSSLHDYNVKMPKFTFCRGREHKITIFFFFS